MSRWTWIDGHREETWLPGLRAAVLLLRAGQTVALDRGADADAPYLAAPDLPEGAVSWLAEQGLIASDGFSGPSGDALALTAPAVAVFGGAGSPYNHAAILAALGIPWFYATGPDIAAGALRHADVLIVPGGGWRFGNAQLADLGESGARAARRFIEEGGGYLSSCAGSTIAMRQPEAALAAYPPSKADFTLLDVDNWEPLRDAPGGHRSPGIGRVVARLPSSRHPIAIGLPERLEITHYNGPIFAEPTQAASIVVRYAGTTDAFTPSECFFGHDGRPTERDRDASLMAEAGRLGLPAIVAGGLGRGRVVMAGLHPEFGPDQGLDAWGRPAQLIGNAVLWLAQHGRGRDERTIPRPIGDVGAAEFEMDCALSRMARAIAGLQAADRQCDERWLTDATPRAAFGRTPDELWRAGLETLPTLHLRARHAWAEARRTFKNRWGDRLAGAMLQRYEPEGGPDLGAQGSVWLLDEASRLVEEAAVLLERQGRERIRAEHLVTRSYLSALGLLANAAQRIETEKATYLAEDDLARLQDALKPAAVVAAS